MRDRESVFMNQDPVIKNRYTKINTLRMHKFLRRTKKREGGVDKS